MNDLRRAAGEPSEPGDSGEPGKFDERELRALAALAADDSLEMPDVELQQRLTRLAARRTRAGGLGASWRSLPRWRGAAALLLTLGLAGGALGATFGLEGLRRLWIRITIDGRETQQTLEGEGAHELDFTTEDGYRVQVRVERRALPEQGRETSVRIREEGGGVVDEEVHELSTTPSAGAPPERLLASELDGARVLHTWTGPAGVRNELLLDRDPEGAGSRLLRHEAGSTLERPYSLVLRTAQRIALGGLVTVVERDGGQLEVSLSDGHGWELAFVLAPDDSALPRQASELSTPSGRVHVRVDD